VGAELAVRAGAEGSFFGLFDKSVTKTLFTKNFEIFKVGVLAFSAEIPSQSHMT
jgi:hypothetical protein